ncbi:MAG: hypothetical protein HON23_00910 [Rickettsiales bacterium]|jgi:hypothetical protein|nr:hypothetical protein [Rickettsiales bacterium]
MASHTELLTFLLFVIVGILATFYTARIVRFVFYFLRYIILATKHRPDFSGNRDPKKHKKPPKFGTDDFKLRNRKSELALASENINKNTEMQVSEETTIVGIAEPIGRWTKYVTSQKISWLQAMVGSKMESDSFWQNMVKAQQKASSKHKGRTGPGM